MARPFPISRIGAGAHYMVEASAEECRALAARMGILAIHCLTCRYDLSRGEADRVHAQGLLRARVRQTCVVSLDSFDEEIIESFSLRFVPGGAESAELDLEADDEIPYEGGVLDLGEASSEQLALALDPFPRKPGVAMAKFADAAEGGAFQSLAKLLPPN